MGGAGRMMGTRCFPRSPRLRRCRRRHRSRACVVLIEGCEESGSFDLPFHVEALAARIGQPSLVVCLDAECADYDRLWMTTSLRGKHRGRLEYPDAGRRGAFRERQRHRGLLCRCAAPIAGPGLECADRELLKDLYVEIPEERLRQAAATAEVLGDSVRARMPFAKASPLYLARRSN